MADGWIYVRHLRRKETKSRSDLIAVAKSLVPGRLSLPFEFRIDLG